MKENTNKAIVLNSLILYLRLGIVAISSLFTTRFALQALGVDDYGIFSVVGGVISFISIINTIMLNTSNRFIATAIGKGDIEEVNKQFNVNLLIHTVIAVFTVLIAFPLGDWYINNYINYSGSIRNVILVYRVTIIGAIISFIGVPYNGLLMAKERFFVFCSTDVISHLLKMIVSFCLIYFFSSKLLVYSITISLLSAYPVIVFWNYCHRHFRDICRFNLVREKKMYKEVFSFSIWVGYGAIATIGKNQGAALIINNFFSTVMNTALGIANSVNGILLSFSSNVSKSISPQIVKNYASSNYDRCKSLVVLASKSSFLILLLVSSPFIVAPDFIFTLWLGKVPDYVVIFTYLIIADALVGSLNAGIPDLIFASGNIKWYQFLVNTLFILSVIAGFFVLKAGFPAHYLQITYLAFSFVVLVLRQIILNKVVKFKTNDIIIKSYLPSLFVLFAFIPILFLKHLFHPILLIVISILYLLLLCYIIGLNKSEKRYIYYLLVSKIKKS